MKIPKQNQLKIDKANKEQAKMMANLSNSVKNHDTTNFKCRLIHLKLYC